MSAAHDPIVSEFETAEQEASYTAWLKAKVQASLDDSRPSIAHDEVMAEMEAIISCVGRIRSVATIRHGACTRLP